MPRPFDEEEQRVIRRRLKRVGLEKFGAAGLRKTTIDELAQSAGIAKGSFYRFWDSKEDLFFDLLEDVQDEIRGPFMEPSEEISDDPEEAFRKFVHRMLAAFDTHPILRVLTREDELSVLMRKVAPSRLEKHRSGDQEFISDMIRRCQGAGDFRPANPEAVSGVITLMVLSNLHRDFVGERLYPVVSDLMVDLLCEQLFKPAS